MAVLSYVRIGFKCYREFKIQKQFITDFLNPYLGQLEQTHHGKFNKEQKIKIKKYYGIGVFLCSSYKWLYGGRLSGEERKRAAMSDVLSAVGDDLFDIDKLSVEDIRTITFNPEAYKPVSFTSGIAKEIQTYLLQHVPFKAEYIKASAKVLEMQVESVQQTKPGLSRQKIADITFAKGTAAATYWHLALDDAPPAQMADIFYYIGSLNQLGNDIFSVFNDVRDDIYTLANTCDDYPAFKQEFVEMIRAQNRLIRQLPYKRRDKKQFLVIINAFNACSLVGLDQFARLQKKLGGKINWPQQQRAHMVVDMEKFVNRLRWIRYILQVPLWK